MTYSQIKHGVHRKGGVAGKKGLPERKHQQTDDAKSYTLRPPKDTNLQNVHRRHTGLIQSQKDTPCFLHQLLLRLFAGDLRHIAAGAAVDGRVGDVTDGQEVGSQAPHAQLCHVGERLAHAATEQKASQLFVQARHVEVSNEGP